MWVKAVDGVLQFRFWSSPLVVAIDRVCEPDGTIRVQGEVGQGIKSSAIEVVQDRLCLESTRRFIFPATGIVLFVAHCYAGCDVMTNM